MLVTTVGAYSANSYITLEEAEEILSNLGMKTEAWRSLTIDFSKIIGTTAGPFSIIPGVNDTLLLSVVDGDEEDQIVTFIGGGENYDEAVILTATQACVIINNQTTNITATPTTDNKIKLSVVTPTCTLYIKSVHKSVNYTFGLAYGDYSDIVPYKKEYMLKVAAMLIGMLPLAGRRIYQQQMLDFPRTTVVDYNTIPPEVKEAQALIACLVVQPNLDRQTDISDSFYIPIGMQNTTVTSVKVAGIMDVKTENSSSADISITSRTLLESIADVFMLPVYMRLKPFLTQVGGVGALIAPSDYQELLLPPVEEIDLSELDLEIDLDGGDFTPLEVGVELDPGNFTP
jgi:hypothetical protein